MELMKQKQWYICESLHFFLASAGAGIFSVNFGLSLTGLYNPIVRWGFVLSLAVIVIDSVVLIMGSGVKSKAILLWPLVKGWRTSWMSRGVIILVLFIICASVYAIPALWYDWWYSRFIVLGWTATGIGLFIPVYTSLLIGSSKGVPFWNSAAIPPLFVLSSLLCGIASTILVLSFVNMGSKEVLIQILAISGFVLIIVEIITLAAYLLMGKRNSVAFDESVRLVTSGRLACLFWIGVISIGSILPVIVTAVSFSQNSLYLKMIAVIVSSIMVLLGAIFLREILLRAGIYVSMHTIRRR